MSPVLLLLHRAEWMRQNKAGECLKSVHEPSISISFTLACSMQRSVKCAVRIHNYVEIVKNIKKIFRISDQKSYFLCKRGPQIKQMKTNHCVARKILFAFVNQFLSEGKKYCFASRGGKKNTLQHDLKAGHSWVSVKALDAALTR